MTGSGAYIRTLPSSLDRFSLVRDLPVLARVPGALLETVRGYAERGLEFMAALQSQVAGSSSTLRELFSVSRFIRAIAHLLRGGRSRVFLDNLGCVFILGCVVPESTIGNKWSGEFVSGGPPKLPKGPNPALQSMACELFLLQLNNGIALQAVWLPRELKKRADYLLRVSEMRHHDYSIRPAVFRQLNVRWDADHSVLHALFPPRGRMVGYVLLVMDKREQLAIPPGHGLRDRPNYRLALCQQRHWHPDCSNQRLVHRA